MARLLFFWLKLSRPGLWFQTVWLYLLPTSGHAELLGRFSFWYGLFFVTFPLSALVYGWNDHSDYEIDRLNPRKDSYLFGARATRQELDRVPRGLLVLFGVPALGLVLVGGVEMLAVVAAILLLNATYNWPRVGLRTMPPLELLNQLGYLVVLSLSWLLNDVAPVPNATIFYLMLFCTHAHLMGEVMDVRPDRAAGRRTTATVIGIRPTKWIVAALVAVEGVLVWMWFDEPVLGVFLLSGSAWLVADVALLFRDRDYTPGEFRLFGVALNAAGFASILWVWWRGSLTAPLS